ncbi:MAG: GTP-binding protein [Methanomassiliicoccales archaeon]|nr:MAG: GTP-binding protein [Methanomassiliicoccales archaeon]
MVKVKNIIKKMCVIGEEAVGKTSLIRRFVVDKFDDKYIATIGTKSSKKTLIIKDDNVNVNLTMIIWDVLGQKKFAELKKSAFKGSNGAFIVLDLTRRETLYSFDEWLSSLFEVAGDIPVVILANKNDLKSEYGKDEINRLVKRYDFPFYLTSAKTGENVNQAFHKLGKMMIDTGSKKIEPELKDSKPSAIKTESGKALSALDVEDIIMARYCDLLEDTDFAMAIIREQFKRAGVNFKYPTVEGLEKVVDYLIKAASDRVEAARLAREERAYTNLIKMIGKDTT